jgi:hypothetical protein
MFEPSSGSLDFQLNKDEEIFYFIDFSKLGNVNDLVKVLASMGFGISDKNPHYEEIKQFLDLDRPVKLK